MFLPMSNRELGDPIGKITQIIDQNVEGTLLATLVRSWLTLTSSSGCWTLTCCLHGTPSKPAQYRSRLLQVNMGKPNYHREAHGKTQSTFMPTTSDPS